MSNNNEKHDLSWFLENVSNGLQNEYDRIQTRILQDPGTAGDQGEENWAEILRKWLPSYFTVITKGRILFENGEASPQIDILILSPEYPPILNPTKLYIASGVIAAFECKITLRSEHFEKLFENSAYMKSRYNNYKKNPMSEIKSGLLYGLLAHSHEWKKKNSNPNKNMSDNLVKYASLEKKIKLLPDIVCVNDLSSSSLNILISKDYDIKKKTYSNSIYISANYQCQNYFNAKSPYFKPISSFLVTLLHQISLSYNNLAPIAQYFSYTNIHGQASSGINFTKILITDLSKDFENEIINSNQDSWRKFNLITL
jgi:hypothetical protein